MKTLTIKQPWASLIVSGIKDIENRTWPTKFRGRILIHAGKDTVFNAYMPDGSTVSDRISELELFWNYDSIPHGAIIGSIEIVDCVINHPSVWAEKSIPTCDTYERTGGHDCDMKTCGCKPIYNWVLANPILFDKPITEVKGRLSLWEFDFNALPQIEQNKIMTR